MHNCDSPFSSLDQMTRCRLHETERGKALCAYVMRGGLAAVDKLMANQRFARFMKSSISDQTLSTSIYPQKDSMLSARRSGPANADKLMASPLAF